jgi:hypothetical protein
VFFRYGDKIPTSIAGRLFSVVVILYGTVLTGLITVSLTAALTVTVVIVSTDVKLYGSHVREMTLMSIIKASFRHRAPSPIYMASFLQQHAV